MKFDQKIVVVTGGASGIGAACATLFAARGASVVIADRNVDAAATVARRLGGNAVTLDVGDENSVEKAAAEIEVRGSRALPATRVVSVTSIIGEVTHRSQDTVPDPAARMSHPTGADSAAP